MHFVTDDTFPWTPSAQAPFVLPILPLVLTKVLLIILIACVFACLVFHSSLFSLPSATNSSRSLAIVTHDTRYSALHCTSGAAHTPRNIPFTWPQPRSSSRLPVHRHPWKALLDILHLHYPQNCWSGRRFLTAARLKAARLHELLLASLHDIPVYEKKTPHENGSQSFLSYLRCCIPCWYCARWRQMHKRQSLSIRDTMLLTCASLLL